VIEELCHLEQTILDKNPNPKKEFFADLLTKNENQRKGIRKKGQKQKQKQQALIILRERITLAG